MEIRSQRQLAVRKDDVISLGKGIHFCLIIVMEIHEVVFYLLMASH